METNSKFDIPEFYSALFPGISLIQSFLPGPRVPNLSDYGLDKKSVDKFFNAKKDAVTSGLKNRASHQIQAIAGALPSLLRSSTVPASFSSQALAQTSGDIAVAESQIEGDRFSAYSNIYNNALNAFGLQNQVDQQRQGRQDSILDFLSLLPLL